MSAQYSPNRLSFPPNSLSIRRYLDSIRPVQQHDIGQKSRPQPQEHREPARLSGQFLALRPSTNLPPPPRPQPMTRGIANTTRFRHFAGGEYRPFVLPILLHTDPAAIQSPTRLTPPPTGRVRTGAGPFSISQAWMEPTCSMSRKVYFESISRSSM
jgi:hypothetical protein